MRFCIIDDDAYIRGQIDAMLRRLGEEEQMKVNISAYDGPAPFLDEYENQYDILLIDVDMPGMNGIEMAKVIRKRDPYVTIMFVTNLAQYAIYGYDVEAIDYVLKPVAYPEFSQKLKKAVRIAKNKQNLKVVLTTTEGVRSVKLYDIGYVESNSHYLYYHVKGEILKVRDKIANAEEELTKYGFYRINNGYLVNMKKITYIGKTDVTVDGDNLPVARQRRVDFLRTFSLYSSGIGG
ncbi:MAG: LytTR family DNA-binding domain-containing protein [Butyrivibrio sp.]|nr:LytTR family DNA-binding domain-containing protein [Butyrivibrio sp.]